jgi:hypothetical protein
MGGGSPSTEVPKLRKYQSGPNRILNVLLHGERRSRLNPMRLTQGSAKRCLHSMVTSALRKA